MQQDQGPILVEEIPCEAGLIGLISFNRPRSLNAFNGEMAATLIRTLAAWSGRDDIALVALRGEGPKSFCAGGDVRRVIEILGDENPDEKVRERASAYFKLEYSADYALHRYPKPVLVWGHGYVLGGGWGLLAGGSHRVVTPSTQLAMPEILIGLFPDVAASWFLNRLSPGLGRFLALTASRLSAKDAITEGLAHHLLPEDGWQPLLAHLKEQAWSKLPERNSDLLHNCLYHHSLPLPEEPTPKQRHADTIRELGHLATLESFADAFLALPSAKDPWLGKAQAQFRGGSPNSLVTTFRLLEHSRHLSLRECFILDTQLMLSFALQPDFHEGIRAMLIDKDNNPQWRAKTIADVDRQWIDRAFQENEAAAMALLDGLPG